MENHTHSNKWYALSLSSLSQSVLLLLLLLLQPHSSHFNALFPPPSLSPPQHRSFAWPPSRVKPLWEACVSGAVGKLVLLLVMVGLGCCVESAGAGSWASCAYL